MVIIFIGASGVGKSTLAKKLATRTRYTYHDMDEETDIKTHRHAYLNQAARDLQKYSLDKTTTHILDFGAGFQNQPCFFHVLQRYADKLITVHEEDPRKIYRNRIPDRPFEEFMSTEHAPHREKLYNLAGYKLTRSANSENDVAAIISYFRLKTIIA
jgi:dephospho-CoA kinase